MALEDADYIESALILRKVGTTILVDAGAAGATTTGDVERSIQTWTDALNLTVAELRGEGVDGKGGVTNLYGVAQPSGVPKVEAVDYRRSVVSMGPEEMAFVDSALTVRAVARIIRRKGDSKAAIEADVVAWADALARTVSELRREANAPIYLDGGADGSEGVTRLFGISY